MVRGAHEEQAEQRRWQRIRLVEIVTYWSLVIILGSHGLIWAVVALVILDFQVWLILRRYFDPAVKSRRDRSLWTGVGWRRGSSW